MIAPDKSASRDQHADDLPVLVLPGRTLALACSIWGDHWAPNEITGLIAFGDAYAAAVAAPVQVPPAAKAAKGRPTHGEAAPFTADRLIATAAFRYALGRMNYMPSHVAEWLRAHRRLLSDHDRHQIIREIDEAARRDGLGWPCDVETWMALRAALSNEPEDGDA